VTPSAGFDEDATLDREDAGQVVALDWVSLTLPQAEWVRRGSPADPDKDGRPLLWRAGNQVGKAGRITSLILTRTGWRRMGEIRVGDEIIAGDGSVTRVEDVIPQGRMQLYRVTFDNGATTESTEQHVWRVWVPGGGWAEMELREIVGRWGPNPPADLRVRIPAFGQPLSLNAEPGPALVSVILSDVDECQCITVAHPSGTYVTDDYIVTHNSFSQAVKILRFILRQGEYATRPPGPVKVLVVSISKEQMIPLMDKLWELLPKDAAPTARYRDGFGFRGKPPTVLFADGSLITFATYSQGSVRIAGATVDVVVLDEPPPESMWSEVMARVFRRGGQVWCTFTLTLDSPPVEYLKKEVEEGRVREMKTRLDLDAFRRQWGMPPMMTNRAIARFVSSLLEVERAIRVDAEWEIVSRGAWLTLWGAHCISDEPPPPGARLYIGTDHGARAGRQASALLAIAQVQDQLPGVWLLEEYVSDGLTMPDQDAQGVLAMLARRNRNGTRRDDVYDPDGPLTWKDVDFWIGDRAAGMIQDARKDNATLRRAIADQVGIRQDAFPRVDIPHKYRSSRSTGLRLVNALMGQLPGRKGSALRVAPHLTAFPAAVKQWAGDNRAKEKDILDAFRYPCEVGIKSGDWNRTAGVYRLVQ
jgi:phage terminase large subunit-like protein